MRIENFRTEKGDGRKRVAATVSWEDCERLPKDIYFETDDAFEEQLSCNPHAFLIGATITALEHGEKRVAVDAEICPELQEGLIIAMNWLRHWYYQPDQELVKIEARERNKPLASRIPERAGVFFSGGIDSLAAVRINRLNYPLEHPGSYKDALIIYGQNIESDVRSETFKQALFAFSKVTDDVGIRLIPVYTNIRDLDNRSRFFIYKFHGAILASVAHVFSQTLTSVSIASDNYIPDLGPWGSHLLLNSNYGSNDLRIRHTEVELSRLAKTQILVDWNLALQNIKVCGPNWPGENCGQCEKCIRTMLELLALGVLGQTDAFPRNDVSEDLIRSVIPQITDPYKIACYRELVAPLTEKGRYDLVRAINEKLEEYEKRQNKMERVQKIKRFDDKYFSGRLLRLNKKFGLKRFI